MFGQCQSSSHNYRRQINIIEFIRLSTAIDKNVKIYGEYGNGQVTIEIARRRKHAIRYNRITTQTRTEKKTSSAVQLIYQVNTLEQPILIKIINVHIYTASIDVQFSVDAILWSRTLARRQQLISGEKKSKYSIHIPLRS